jgi:hypothetical protein
MSSFREISDYLKCHTDGHGYAVGCCCDLEGGDPDYKI